MRNLVILGGGVTGWFTASLLAKRHSKNDLKITLVESPDVPILGVGESTIPHLGDMLRWLEVDENKWMKGTRSVYKLGNHFVGWNSETPKNHVTDHWNAPKSEQQFYHFSITHRDGVFKKSFQNKIIEEDYLYDNDGSYGIDNKSYDYALQLVREGKISVEDVAEYTSDQYYLAMKNKSPYDMDNDLLLGDLKTYAWHVDAERFPIIVREQVASPLGVKWIKGYVQNVNKSDNGDVVSLDLKDGSNIEGDIFVDCTGFHRLLMKQMPTKWKQLTHLPTQSAIVAPIKYKDPYNEMKPYTQSYAQKNGWNFIIPLYSRMGSGYIFDKNSEDPDSARERFIKYWDGYDFVKDPRLIQWESGWYEDAWINNVVGVGMSQGLVDPMEANSIYVAQSCIQILDQVLEKYKHKDIPEIAKKSYSRQQQKLEKQISDFISYHFTLSKRKDSPMWKKWGNNTEDAIKNWQEYRSPRGYTGRNMFLDYQWAQQQLYLDRFDKNCDIKIKESLMPLAKVNFDFIKNKGEALSKYAPNVYDYLREKMYNGATPSEVLENDLH